MTHLSPVLTIAIPVFNGQATLATAIKSTLTATDITTEILVSDNASTDATPAICQKFGHAIHYRRNTTNLGFAGNYKQCLKNAQGRYLYFMGADDVIDTLAVQQLVQYLDTHPRVAIVSSNLWYFREQPDQPSRVATYFRGRAAAFTAGDDALSRWLFQSVIGSIGGYLLRTSVSQLLEPRLPNSTITPQLHLAAWIALHHDTAHIACRSMGQRVTDSISQLANKTYLSLTPIHDCLKLIKIVTSQEGLLKPDQVRQALQRTYIKGLVWNIPSYRSFGSGAGHRRLLWLIIYHQPSLIVFPPFLMFALATLALPSFIVRQLLVWHRNGWHKSNIRVFQ